MARKRVNAAFASLARRRPELVSAHFGLSFQMIDPNATPAVADAAASASSGTRALGFAVPRRQLKRAVDRNALKRVAREAWRHARWDGVERPAAAMLKLRRAEPSWASTPRGALKKAWRAELDELFARLVARLKAPPHSRSSR